MASTFESPPRLRDTAIKRRDGSWDLDTILNRELYPAIKKLTAWAVTTITQVVDQSNPLVTELGFLTWLGPSSDFRGTTSAGGTTVTSLELDDGFFYTITFEISVKNSTGPAYYYYWAVQSAYRDGGAAVRLGAESIVYEEPGGGSFSVTWSQSGNEIRMTFNNASAQAVGYHAAVTFTRKPMP